ncbi:MAG TPA: hypothetical protein VIG41_02955 [Micrococcaceae bacterium]|jgi:hypothetical protein
MTSKPARESSAGQPGVPERREIIVRRAPKFVPFLVAGGIVGVLVAAVVAWGAPGNAEYDRSTIFGFFAVLLAVPGVVSGGIVALILDRVSIRRMERAVVESVPETAAETAPGKAPGPDAERAGTAGPEQPAPGTEPDSSAGPADNAG